MSMKKCIVFVVFCALLVLVACNVDSDKTTQSTNTEAKTSASTSSSEPSQTTEPKPKDPNTVYISYASWGNAEIEKRMIEKFEE